MIVSTNVLPSTSFITSKLLVISCIFLAKSNFSVNIFANCAAFLVVQIVKLNYLTWITQLKFCRSHVAKGANSGGENVFFMQLTCHLYWALSEFYLHNSLHSALSTSYSNQFSQVKFSAMISEYPRSSDNLLGCQNQRWQKKDGLTQFVILAVKSSSCWSVI